MRNHSSKVVTGWKGLRILLMLTASSLGVASVATGVGSNAVAGASNKVTLVVQDADGGEAGLLAGYATLNKEFEAAHPGVTVHFEAKSFNDVMNTLKLQLSGSTVPDVTQVNQGYSSMGELIADNLLVNLNPYAAQYGWNKLQTPSLIAMDGQFSTNGKKMGSGPLWAVSATGGWVGIFEDLTLAHKLGITAEPTTLSQLQTDMALAKKHGILPFQLGTSDGGMSSWLTGSLMMAQSSPKNLFNLVNAVKGSSMQTPLVIKAATMIRSWAKAGYFTSGFAAYSNSDVFTQFGAGKGLFTINGAWNVPMPAPAKPTNFVMLPFPTASASTGAAAIGPGDMPWAVPSKSQHKALAAQYINFIASRSAASTWVKAGAVPLTIPSNLSVVDTKLVGPSKDAVTEWAKVVAAGNVEPFLDWATPTFYNTLEAAVPELVSGRITPTQFATQLQGDYGKFLKSNS